MVRGRPRRSGAPPRIIRQVHPSISFGRPCFEGTGVPVAILAGMVSGGDRPEDVAEDYDLPVAWVLRAVEAEAERRRRKKGETYYPCPGCCEKCRRTGDVCRRCFHGPGGPSKAWLAMEKRNARPRAGGG